MIDVFSKKTLKLTNVLIQCVTAEDIERMSFLVVQQVNYLKGHGAKPLGPMIEYVKPTIDENGQLILELKLLRQSDTFLHHVNPPYEMQSLLRVPNCMYVRFIGKESNLHFAYEKVGVVAFEEGIKLKGDYYTIHVDQQDDILTADIFMPRADNDD